MRAIDLIPPDVHARRETDNRVKNWARLLGLFALAAVLLARSSHRRVEPGGKRPPEPPTDAWQEAGRRLTPPEAGVDD